VKQYPLKALELLRRKHRERALRELARRARETTDRRAALQGVVEAGTELEQRAQGTGAAELRRAQQGGSRAVDWQRLGAHELTVRHELQRLQQREAVEKARLAESEDRESHARGDLLRREVDERVVAQHRLRFEDEQRSRAELELEEEALDHHLSRRAR
jgi:hypothetical protein